MLFSALFATLFFKVICETTDKKITQITFPVPVEFPNRNDRSDQCWLRIEDVELMEMVAVYCHIAQKFLGYYIQDYNSKKMTEDGVAVSLWIEKPRGEKDEAYGPPGVINGVLNWRVATVMDPTTMRRIYVSKNSICKVVMYSREGISNYIVDCPTILYFVNEHMNGNAVSRASVLVIAVSVFLVQIVI